MGILDLFGAGPIATVVDDILKMFPNAEQRAAAANKLEDLAAQIAASQSATNTAEAQTGNLFIAGWRPALGWICVAVFGCSTLVALYNSVRYGTPFDQTTLNNTLWGLLGLGTMRTAEKLGGVATAAIKKIFK